MSAVVSSEANVLTAQAMYKAGASTREVARKLKVSPYTAWSFKQRETVDPTLVGHISKTIQDKLLLAASSATDALLEQAIDGTLKAQEPIALAKTASICLQSAGAYAALSGASDMLSGLAHQLGIVQSHSVSRMTLEQKITVESSSHASQPVDSTSGRTPKQGA